MIDIVRFTDEELELIAERARQRRTNAHSRGARPRGALPDVDLIELDLAGMRGELAVAKALGVPLPPYNGRTAVDLVLDSGLRLEVKYRNRADRDLMVLTARPVTEADALVLVVPTSDPRAVRIAGAITVSRFYTIRRIADFTYGATDYVEQGRLTPWSAFVELLEERW